MKPVLTVFFDGLKPDSLEYMPFLASLPYKRRMRTILGYSITCHASMYSGVYPDKHEMWFLWQYAPQTSPFRWLESMKFLQYLDCLPTRLFLHKITTIFIKRTAYWGIPRIVNLPVRYWPKIDVAESLYWDEDGYLPGYPTIFELLRASKIPYEVVGMVKTSWETSSLVAEYRFTEIKPWTYLFIGDVDGLSHRYLQSSPIVIEKLRRFDGIVEARYRELEAKGCPFDFFVFSDHGHVQVRERINLYDIFRQANDNLNHYMHLIDANFARFWFRDEIERKQVENILSQLKNGKILSLEDMQNNHVLLSTTKCGELIYYLDIGSIFTWTTFGYGQKQISMHGYRPNFPGCDGIFLSNKPIAVDEYINLVDILPSLLALFQLDIPSHVDGHVIWE